MNTHLFYNPVFAEHDTGPGHPERAERVTVVMDRLESSGLLAKIDLVEPASTSGPSVARVHDPDYIATVEKRSRSIGKGDNFYEDMDTVGSSATYRSAMTACGAAIEACDAVLDGRAANAFCLARPPGHHAEKDCGKGFCFFNNIAVAARHVQSHRGIGRVAIIDWDVHHGNGTQNTFYEDGDVFYFSIHQYPHYPGSGAAHERGVGEGKGATLNVPVARGSSDKDYLDIFNGKLKSALREFKPQIILVSAGFDAHEADPLSGVYLSTECFGELTGIIMELAMELCSGRVVSMLEGGYELNALADSVTAHLRALLSV